MPAAKGNKYALGNNGGRPLKYKPEYCQEIIKFFSSNPYDIIEGKVKVNDLPTFEKFAVNIDVCVDSLHEWKKRYKEFFEAYKKAQQLQKNFLITNALLGNYNSTFAIFTAKNITDMRDVIENKNINYNKDLNNLTEKEIDKEIAKYEKQLKNGIK